MSTHLVTGGAGFIGSNFVELLLKRGERVVVLDLLTYAGSLENLKTSLATYSEQLEFVHGNICDPQLVEELFQKFNFDSVINFAAESHVDRSIASAAEFVQTNVIGVYNLLEVSHKSWDSRPLEGKTKFRFIQVSTDEVFGTLGDTGYFNESTPYAPSSPYSASKASGDHLARAWFHTYKLPVIITNCSNNYGPHQFPEKLIPYMIACALSGERLPVYGSGQNVRDWIHVQDHCEGVWLALTKGEPGQQYCFGGRSERRNINVVEAICDQLDKLRPRADKRSYSDQIAFVEDRKGHDWRYAIDDTKAEKELGFKRQYPLFEDGLGQTVKWYLDHQDWVQKVLSRNKS